MRNTFFVFLLVVILVFSQYSSQQAPAYYLSHVAGGIGDGGHVRNAILSSANSIRFNSKNELFIADVGNNNIRKVDVNGKITTVAGNGITLTYGPITKDPTKISLNAPASVAIDSQDNIYIADTKNNVTRKIDVATGKISTVMGGKSDSAEDTPASSGLDVSLYGPKSIVFDSEDNMYISDTSFNRVLKMFKNGTVITFAGKKGTSGYVDNVSAANCLLKAPLGLFVDNSLQELYIADSGNNRVRKVFMSNGTIITVAGNGATGTNGNGGPAISAQVPAPNEIVLWNNTLIITDSNNEIRKVDSNGIISLLTKWGPSLSFTSLASTSIFKGLGLTVGPDGILYFTSSGTSYLGRIYANNSLEIINYEYISKKNNGDNIPARLSGIGIVNSVIETLSGDLFVSCEHVIYKINTEGIMTRFAGINQANAGYSGDGGDAKNAQLYVPKFLMYEEKTKELTFLDGGNSKFRRILSDGTIQTVANSSNPTFAFIRGAVLDLEGNIISYDYGDGYLKKTFLSNGTIVNLMKIPGSGDALYALHIDKNGTLFYVDSNSASKIYKIHANFTKEYITSVPFKGAALFKDDQDNFIVASGTVNTVSKIGMVSKDGVYRQIAGFDGYKKLEEGDALTIATGNIGDVFSNKNGTIYFTDFTLTGSVYFVRKLTPFTCYGIYSNSSNVCSSNGACSKIDTCSCNEGYYGNNCEYVMTCNGILFNDTNVCSGNGTCSNFKCNCAPNMVGNDCSLYQCFGIWSNDSTVCNGHGNCFNSTCNCNSDWTGANCSQPVLAVQEKQKTRILGGSLALSVIEGSSKESLVFGNILATRVLSNGDVIISDSNRILIIRQGKVHVLVGTGEVLESDDSSFQASKVPILLASGMVVDATEENLYFCEVYRIRKINLSSGNISTVVGLKGVQLNLGDSGIGSVSNTPIYGCSSIAIGMRGEIYFTEKDIHQVKKVENGQISVIAGNRLLGYTSQSSQANTSSISYPDGITYSNVSGSIYVSSSDATNSISVIYEITNSGIMTPIAGTNSIGSSGLGSTAINSKLSSPNDIVFYNGELFISERGNCRVTKITTNGTIEKVAGLDSCPVSTDSSTEFKNSAIATSYYLPKPSSITISNNKLYIGAELLYEVDLISGKIAPFAGVGFMEESDGYTANDLFIYGASSMFVYSSSEVYLAIDGRLVQIVDGKVSTIMGYVAYSSFYSVGTPQRISTTNFPLQGKVSPYNIFNSKISFISKDRVVYFFNKIGQEYYLQSLDISSMVVHTFSNGSSGVLNEGSVSTSTSIQAGNIFVDDQNNIYVTQPSSHTIIKINSDNGKVARIAGTPSSSGDSVDGTLAINAQLNTPKSIYVYPNGDILFTDSQNNALKKIKMSDGKIEKIMTTSPPMVTGIIVSGDNIYLGYPNKIVRINNGTEYPYAGTGQPPQLNDLETISETESTSAKITASFIGIFGGKVYSLTTANSLSVILSFDPYFTCNLTCNNGECSSESTCQCDLGWTGERCDSVVTCNGKYYNDTNSCGGSENGMCISPNVCSCKTGYFGNECTLLKCFDILSNETNTVCSGHGSCLKSNNCTCTDGWYGSDCSEYYVNNSTNATCVNMTCTNSTFGNSSNVDNNSTHMDNSTCANNTIGNENSTIGNSTYVSNSTTEGNSTNIGNNTNVSNVTTTLNNNTTDTNSNSTINNSTNNLNNTTTNNSTENVNSTSSGNSTDIGNSTYVSNSTTEGNSTLNNNTTDVNSNSTINNATNSLNNNSIADCYNSSCTNSSSNSTSNNGTGNGNITNNSTLTNSTDISNNSTANSTIDNSTETNRTDGNATISNNTNSDCNTCINGLCKNSVCTCNEGWTGSYCDTLITCFGKLFNDSQVCGGSGVCKDVNNCICSSKNSKVVINGTLCQNIYCQSVNNLLIASDDSMVCNGMGTCDKNGCLCKPNFSGFDCQVNNSKVAQCPTNYYGSSCDKYCEATSTCSSNGKCTQSGDCECSSDIINGFFNGTSCNQCQYGFSGIKCSLGFFGPVQYSDFGDGFKFTYFNSYISNRLTITNCSEIFPESLRSKLGTNPVCTWVDREIGDFKVTFGIGATLKVGEDIVINLKANSGSAALYSAPISLQKPNNPIKPVIIIRKKDSYGMDEGITLDASQSYSGDKNDLIFRWSSSQNIPSIQALSNVLDRPIVVISKEESSALTAGTYTIQLVVTSQLLNLSNTEVFSFEKKSTILPHISIIGKSNIVADSRNLPMIIKKSADIGDDSKLIIEWTKISNTAPVEYHVDEFNNLVITNFSADGFNQVHEFQIRVKIQGDESKYSSSTVTVKQLSSPQTLEMYITDFNIDYIEFNVKNVDFDESLGVVANRVWACEQQDGTPCDSSILTLLNSFNNENQIKIKKSDFGLLTNQDSVKITLTIVKNNIKSISKTLTVNIPKQDSPPIVKATISKGRSTNKDGVSMLKMGDKFSVQLSPLKVENTQQLERIWMLNGQSISNEMLKYMKENINLSRSNSIVIDTSKLDEGSINTIQVTITDPSNGKSIVQEFTFGILSSPSSCSCKIYPLEGISFKTDFTFLCSNCQNEEGSYSFEFGYIEPKTNIPVSLIQNSNKISAQLPLIDPSIQNIQVYYKIVDSLTGSESTTFAQVKLSSDTSKNVSQALSVITGSSPSSNSIQKMLKDGNTLQASTDIALSSSSLLSIIRTTVINKQDMESVSYIQSSLSNNMNSITSIYRTTKELDYTSYEFSNSMVGIQSLVNILHLTVQNQNSKIDQLLNYSSYLESLLLLTEKSIQVSQSQTLALQDSISKLFNLTITSSFSDLNKQQLNTKLSDISSTVALHLLDNQNVGEDSKEFKTDFTTIVYNKQLKDSLLPISEKASLKSLSEVSVYIPASSTIDLHYTDSNPIPYLVQVIDPSSTSHQNTTTSSTILVSSVLANLTIGYNSSNVKVYPNAEISIPIQSEILKANPLGTKVIENEDGTMYSILSTMSCNVYSYGSQSIPCDNNPVLSPDGKTALCKCVDIGVIGVTVNKKTVMKSTDTIRADRPYYVIGIVLGVLVGIVVVLVLLGIVIFVGKKYFSAKKRLPKSRELVETDNVII